MKYQIMTSLYAGIFLRLPVIIAFHFFMKLILIRILKYDKLIVERKLLRFDLILILLGILNHL